MEDYDPKINHPDERPESIDAAKAAVLDMINSYLYIARKHSMRNFDDALMNGLRLITASSDPLNGNRNPSVLWEIDITPAYCNLNSVMHGGAAALIFDMGTVTALCPVQRVGYWDFMGGVTRSLNVSYLKAVPAGTTVRVRAWVVQHGKTMALIRGQMESVDGKTVYATVEHHKVNVPSQPAHLELREEFRAAMKEREKADGRDKSKL